MSNHGSYAGKKPKGLPKTPLVLCDSLDPEHPAIQCAKESGHTLQWHEGPSPDGVTWHTWVSLAIVAQLDPAV